MIAHVVSFKWREDVNQQDVAEVQSALDALPAKVPVVVSCIHGPDMAWREGNADYAFIALLDTDDPREFFEHPAHLEVVTDLIAPRVAGRSSVQMSLDAPLRIVTHNTPAPTEEQDVT